MEKFTYEKNGYNRSEVNKFIQDIINETEAIIMRCKLQAKQIDLLTKEVNRYKDLNMGLNELVKKVEENATKSKIMAETEAEQIITKAKDNANRIVNEALIKTEKLEDTSRELERNIKRLKLRINNIIEEQKSIIDDIEFL